MTERSASKTALGVATLRAVHQLIDGEPKVLLDPIATTLAGQDIVGKIIASPNAFQTPGSLGLRSHVVTRSRYTEDRLEAAAARGITQYVLLGAGFDTFAYRQPAWAAPLTIFEVDHPLSQELKRGRLAERHVAVPSNVVYVAGDFEHESLADALRAHGFDFAKPAFFSALGVLVYLTREAVQGLFGFVGSLQQHTEFVFTFSEPDESLLPHERPAREWLAAGAAAAGEPWQTHFTRDELVTSLHASGFSQVEIPTPEEIATLYFSNVIALPPPRRVFLARGIV